MTEWSAEARKTISRVHAGLPSDISFQERRKIVNAAYPFGPREMWPYKAWLKALNAYLAPYNPNTPKKPVTPHLSPLERMMAAARAHEGQSAS